MAPITDSSTPAVEHPPSPGPGAHQAVSPEPSPLRDNPSRRVAAALAVVLFLSMVPVTMLVPVLKELVSDRFNASPFWTHSFMSINMIGAVIAAPIEGHWLRGPIGTPHVGPQGGWFSRNDPVAVRVERDAQSCGPMASQNNGLSGSISLPDANSLIA